MNRIAELKKVLNNAKPREGFMLVFFEEDVNKLVDHFNFQYRYMSASELDKSIRAWVECMFTLDGEDEEMIINLLSGIVFNEYYKNG